MTGPRQAMVHPAVYNERELHLGDGTDCYACRRHVDAVLHNIARRSDPEVSLANNKQTPADTLAGLLWVAFAAGVFVTVLALVVARVYWSLA